jgi:hypothetical protein
VLSELVAFRNDCFQKRWFSEIIIFWEIIVCRNNLFPKCLFSEISFELPFHSTFPVDTFDERLVAVDFERSWQVSDQEMK